MQIRTLYPLRIECRCNIGASTAMEHERRKIQQQDPANSEVHWMSEVIMSMSTESILSRRRFQTQKRRDPQVLASTLFAFGALKLYRRHIPCCREQPCSFQHV